MQHWKWYHSLVLILILLGIFGVAAWDAATFVARWLVVMVLMLAFLYFAGWGITGATQPFPYLINEQFRMSTSKFQMSLWTILILSAYLVAVMANVQARHGLDAALEVAIPEEIWVALGISTVALVGSPLINSTKKNKPTNQEAYARSLKGARKAAYAIADDKEAFVEEKTVGQLVRNTSPKEARLFEILSGEEISNYQVLDLARVQVMMFTLILVVSYGAALGGMFADAMTTIKDTPISAFPAIGMGANALLALSTGGYLVGKAVSQTPEG